jgi:zinc protease
MPPKEELELVRKEALLELEESQRNPGATGRLALLRHIRPFPPSDARYVPTIEEQLQRLRAVTSEQLLQLHRELIGGSHGALAIVGDFDAAELKQVIGKQLGTFRSPQPYLPIPYPVSDAPGTLLQVRTPDKAMAMAALLQPMSASESDPDHAGLKLLEYVLAGESSARLFQRLREKDGLSYSVEGRGSQRSRPASALGYRAKNHAASLSAGIRKQAGQRRCHYGHAGSSQPAPSHPAV